MKKPKKIVKEILDWSSCITYLEKKYKFNHGDYAGLFGENYNKITKDTAKELGIDFSLLEEDLAGKDQTDPEVKIKLDARHKVYKLADSKRPPYQDFWHWICDTKNPSNGSTIYFSNDDLEYKLEDWQKTILGYILDEFGEGENRECEFETSW